MLPLHPTATCHDAPGEPEGPDPGAFMTDYDNHIPPGEFSMPRRFPPPWSVDEADPALDRRCFIVRDANGQALAYVYFEEIRHRHVGAKQRRGRLLGKPGLQLVQRAVEHKDVEVAPVQRTRPRHVGHVRTRRRRAGRSFALCRAAGFVTQIARRPSAVGA